MPENIPTSLLLDGITDLTLVKEWGDYLAKDTENRGPKKVSTSQIRKFFGSIKKIQADFENQKNEILLLEPKLAYAVGRDLTTENKIKKQKTKIKEFYNLLSPLIKDINKDKVSEKVKFKNFVSIIEAIVAYHKAAGGE